MNKSIILISVLTLLFIPIIYSVPQLPCEYWGKVTINGKSATGTIIAEINGKIYSSNLDNGYYRIKINADDPDTSEVEGGREGDKIILKFQNNVKEVEWKQGSFKEDFILIEEMQEDQEEEEVNDKEETKQSTKKSSSSSSSSSSSRKSRSPQRDSITEIYVGATSKDKNTQEKSLINYPPTKTNPIKKSFFASQNFIILLSLIVTILLVEVIVLFYIILR